MDAELQAWLFESTLAVTVALLLVLLLRRPVRALLGASAAYALWLCVPVALLAVLLPRGVEAPLALPVAWQAAPAILVVATPDSLPGRHWSEWLTPLWLAGALASALLLGLQQRRFRRGLGVLYRRDDGLYQTQTATAGLPAVAGVLQPRILLPADFELRYSAVEQALVLEHERLHVRRGDLVANALAALLACLFWFNPLLHAALRRFRLDQELACDERVVARHPHARRHYGEAMLKTQFEEIPLPLGCHWQARHPLKERIEMLKRPTPSLVHGALALVFATGLSTATGYAAWAAQPAGNPATSNPAASSADSPVYLIDVSLDVDGEKSSIQLREQAGESFRVRSAAGKSPVWEGKFAIRPLSEPGTLAIAGELHADGTRVGQPTLAFYTGKTATIQMSTPDGRSIITMGFTARALATDEADMPAAAVHQLQVPPARVTASTQSRMPPPKYPLDAAERGVGGEVVLLVTGAADGSVRDVQVETSTPAGVFDAVSVEAARQWTFTPELRDGHPVEGQVRVPITFSTDEPEAAGGATQG